MAMVNRYHTIKKMLLEKYKRNNKMFISESIINEIWQRERSPERAYDQAHRTWERIKDLNNRIKRIQEYMDEAKRNNAKIDPTITNGRLDEIQRLKSEINKIRVNPPSRTGQFINKVKSKIAQPKPEAQPSSETTGTAKPQSRNMKRLKKAGGIGLAVIGANTVLNKVFPPERGGGY
jgi:hypothetical protein